MSALNLASEALEIVIPGWVPHPCLGINGRNRSHWGKVSSAKVEARERVTLALLQDIKTLGYSVLCLQRARVTFTFTFPHKRRRDVDNLAGRVKPCLDVLVREGVLVDDDAEHIELVIRVEVTPKMTETRIMVEATP